MTGHRESRLIVSLWRQGWMWYILSFGLIAVSVYLVHAIRPNPADIMSTILYLGALPWFLQCVAVSMSYYRVLGANGEHRSHIAVLPSILALTVGVLWWVSILVSLRHTEFASYLSSSSVYNMSHAHGVESLGELILYEVIGPLTCPLLLSGPILLTRWNFVWNILSTIGVIMLWSWIGQLLTQLSPPSGRRHRIALAFGGALLYTVPVLVRSIYRMLQQTAS